MKVFILFKCANKFISKSLGDCIDVIRSSLGLGALLGLGLGAVLGLGLGAVLGLGLSAVLGISLTLPQTVFHFAVGRFSHLLIPYSAHRRN